MTRIVLDTNTIVSAIGWGGNPRKILEACKVKKFKLLTTLPLLEELAKVLAYSKFDFIPIFEKEKTLEDLSIVAELVEPKQKIDKIKEDEPDNRVLECALEGRAKFVVSGDVHLLRLKKFKGVNILSSADFVKKFFL